MVARRPAVLALVALALAVCAASAGARTTAVPAPTGLHGFLLRADEPPSTTFPRTPAFAWNPVQGAATYDFQLSTSGAFRDNGIVWQCPSATCPGLETPVAAPALSLPWITGSPHGLYARVRAVMPDGTKGGWSSAFGFDVEPAAAPKPQQAPPGVLRWSTVPGATAYEVWLVDAGKHEVVYTNVLDEREFYTLHESPQWIGAVRWRVRAIRSDWNSDQRVNGVPVSRYGPWSPIYRSTNPNPGGGPIRLGEAISDVVSTGKATDPALRLMPAFTWTGNQSLDGDTAELFRVYVFTDRACLNPVFTSSVVGGRAYAPRPYGGLALPLDTASVAKARSGYLGDLSSRTAEPLGRSLDNQLITSTENEPAAKPTVALPVVASGGGASPGDGRPAITFGSNSDPGAPVSLWDTDWPHSGYYWTVVPVEMNSGAAGATLAAGAPKGTTTVIVTGQPGFKVGDQVVVGAGTNSEVVTISAVAGAAVTFSTATLLAHGQGEPIVRLGSGIAYQDMELPQDVCAAGRVARFGFDSEPSLVAGDDPFASGLSPAGRLTSAVRTDSFFKSPLVSWTPALGADAYQVQWSKTASPFVAAAGPDGTAGTMTGGTSAILPLTPGTWYYRVRGIDWSLPTGAQWMGWSDVTTIVVRNATFKVVKTTKAPKPKPRPRTSR
jgi:hypothetical protein